MSCKFSQIETRKKGYVLFFNTKSKILISMKHILFYCYYYYFFLHFNKLVGNTM